MEKLSWNGRSSYSCTYWSYRSLFKCLEDTEHIFICFESKSIVKCREKKRFLLIFSPPCFLQFEADRRAIIITINSFGTELTKDDRAKLYPRCGKLHPDGLAALARADDYEQVKSVAEYYAVSCSFKIN